MSEQGKHTYDVFISYSHADEERAWRPGVNEYPHAKAQRSFWQAVDHSLDPMLDAWHANSFSVIG